MEKMERPTLGTLKIGDPVIVIDPDARRAEMREFPGEVIKVGRAWVTVRPSWGGDIRFRMSSQSVEPGYGHGGYRFVTPEQHAYDERMTAARRILSDAGIRFDFDSPFRDDDAAQIVAACVALESTEPISG